MHCTYGKLSMTQALTFVCDLSITIYNGMENKNEMK